MCGRYELQEIQGLGARFRATSVKVDFGPRYNAAPGQILPVVVHRDSSHELHNSLELMKWGLVPSWAKDPSIGNKMINARARDEVPEEAVVQETFANEAVPGAGERLL